MAKKNVLGSDPFEWLKKDDKKEDTENKKSDIGDQKKQEEKPADPVVAKEETSVKQEVKQEAEKEVKKKVKQEAKAYEPIDVSVTPKPQVSKAYDKIIEPYLQQEEEAFEPSDISETNRKAVLGKDVYAHHAKSRKTTQKDSPATAFVIVYTVLLLILGFIVYKDLTKQINKLETKLERIEKKLDAGVIDY
ncbi:MAG: hypothetical protein R2568_08810 [Candidatus Scalindua sp.]|nr:hypothetical protein [Candidatus Scalindua sp.]MDV5166833.1 hypothetical protein [Candidatus Scalindua sp.]